MTDAEFISLALSLPDTGLSVHFGRPDLRVKNKIFACPGEGRGGIGVISFTPEQQEMVCAAEPNLFYPVAGGWGRQGSTHFVIEKADQATARSALVIAWKNKAPKSLLKAHPDL